MSFAMDQKVCQKDRKIYQQRRHLPHSPFSEERYWRRERIFLTNKRLRRAMHGSITLAREPSGISDRYPQMESRARLEKGDRIHGGGLEISGEI